MSWSEQWLTAACRVGPEPARADVMCGVHPRGELCVAQSSQGGHCMDCTVHSTYCSRIHVVCNTVPR